MTSEFAVGVHALVFLNHKDCVLSSEELAENICTNPARVRKVLAKLKKKGLVDTKEGLNGGYHMSKKPEDIHLGQICDALQMDSVKMGWKSGSLDKDCMVASGMAGIMDGICQEMNDICREYLNTITIKDIDRKIFG